MDRLREILWVALLVAVLPGAGRSQTVRFDDIQITPRVATAGANSHGYSEVVFRIDSDSAKPHLVEMAGRGTAYGGNCITRVSRQTVVPSASSADMVLPLPPLRAQGVREFIVRIDGRLQRKTLGMNSAVAQHMSLVDSMGGGTAFLVSRALNSDDFGAALDALNPKKDPKKKSRPHGYGGTSDENWYVLWRAEQDAPDWSSNWRSYGRYDAVVLTAADLRAMPAAARSALWQYAECGGALVVLGQIQPPAPWTRGAAVTPGATRYQVGFGNCLVFESASPKALDKLRAMAIQSVATHTRGPLGSVGDVHWAHKMFAVIADMSLPVGGIFLLLFVFSVVAGPVSLLMLSKRNRRIWLLWTTPALALSFSLVVVVYFLFAEGVRSTTRVEGLTLLDEQAKRATTLGMNGFYCPVAPFGGLHYPFAAEVTPCVQQHHHSGGNPRTVDWSVDQHLDEGWVTARVPAYFMIRTSEPRSERLVVQQDAAGSVTVVNGFGVEIDGLCLADGDGKIHVGGTIPAGGQAVLRRVEGKQARAGTAGRLLATRFRDRNWTAGGDDALARPEKKLSPGTYLVRLKGAPFVPCGLKRPGKLRASSLVLGILASGEVL